MMMKVKKLIILLITFVLVNKEFIVSADNETRIKELIQEKNTLIQLKTEHSQIIQNINWRLAEINGALKELERQNEKKELTKEKK